MLPVNLPVLLAQQPAAQPAGFGYEMFLLMGMLFAIMYFMVFLPQRKEQQKYQEMIAGLKKNDEVITSGGLIGKIVRIVDDKLVIQTDDQSNSKITVHRAYVREVLSAKKAEKADD